MNLLSPWSDARRSFARWAPPSSPVPSRRSPLVPAARPAKTLSDLVQLLKASKGQSTYSSAGIASTVHLVTETLLQATHTKARHIPSRGVTGAMMDVLQSQVDFTVAPISLALPQIKSGKIRPLAQTTISRSKLVPDVPTMAEAGYP